MSDSQLSDDLTGARDELLHVVQAIHPKLQGDILTPSESPASAAACLILLRAMVRQAELIIIAAEAGFSEEATANLRVIFEAWVNLLYLVSKSGDDFAVQYRAFALLEFRAHLMDSKSEHEDVEDIDALIEELRQKHPHVLQATELLRSGKVKGQNKLYWCGLGPAKLVSEAARFLSPIVQDPEQLPRFYKFTSWDAHHILTPVLNLDRDKFLAGMIHLGRRQPADEAAQFNCFVAAGMLKQAFSAVKRRWPALLRANPQKA